MTYAIIHSSQEILERALLELINKRLGTSLLSLEQILQDPDFYIIEEEQGKIKIEQIKRLQKKLIYSPLNRKYQFGIIKNASLMTPEAQNSLLKTLEESHENTILVVTINNENSVLSTILSRCNRIYPKEQHVQEERDFLEIKNFLQKTLYEQINEIEKIVKEKKAEDFLRDLADFFRSEHKIKLNLGENTSAEEKILKSIQQAKYRINKNVNTKIALEFICFQIDKYITTYSQEGQ